MTIPASQLVAVNPSVLAAGGSSLDVVGLILTTSTRVPVGAVQAFPDATSVFAYFGATSHEADIANVYFQGFDGANRLPASILFAQYNQSAVAAYLRGGNISALPLASLQALNGVMTLVVDGATHAGSVNLAGATSFSSAAGIIQTALNTATSVTGSVAANVVTGSIAINSVTASIAGTTMTVSAVGSGVLAPGQAVSGTSVVAGTTIVAQLTGTAGSTGTYQVSVSQTVSSTTVVASGGGLTVSAVVSGTLAVGQTISGTGITSGTKITAFATGVGGTGKYAVDTSQTSGSTTVTATGGTLTVTAVGAGVLAVGDVIAGTGITVGNTITGLLTGTGGTGTYLVSVGDTAGSTTITVSGAGVVATYDSVSGAFVVTSGTTGPASSMGFATGAIATSLLLTSATGAVSSQGAAAASPAAFMTAVTLVTTNWVTFMTAFEPDTGGANTAKQAFAAWKSSQNNRYAYVCWDTDITPTQSVPATGSLGYILTNNGDSGTCLVYEATDLKLAAFVCGAAASIDFTQTNGRISFAYKAQSDLAASVTDPTVAVNLGGNPQTSGRGNGYNYYGVYGSANQDFTWFQRGFVTGPFAFLDSYINQIWLNNQLQAALLLLQKNSKSIPYTTAGNALIESALADPIAAGLNFGAYGPGPISSAQAAAVNAAAGAQVANTLVTQGWFLQVKTASSTTRAARTSPPCTFWYLDRGSVQSINLGSVALQ